jgi:hypothetical protein
LDSQGVDLLKDEFPRAEGSSRRPVPFRLQARLVCLVNSYFDRTFVLDQTRRSAQAKLSANATIGWTQDDKAFLFFGGFVDAAGCHEFTLECGQSEVDIPPDDIVRWVRLKSLSDSELEQLKRHVVNYLLRLHDKDVTPALLGAAILSVMMTFAGVPSRPLLWLDALPPIALQSQLRAGTAGASSGAGAPRRRA